MADRITRHAFLRRLTGAAAVAPVAVAVVTNIDDKPVEAQTSAMSAKELIQALRAGAAAAVAECATKPRRKLDQKALGLW